MSAHAIPPTFGLAHLTALGCAPPELTYIAARAGYDFVSFRILPMGLPGEPEYMLAANAAMRRDTRQALADTGLTVNDIELVRITDDFDLAFHMPAFETAAELGARHVITVIATDRRDYASDRLMALCDAVVPLGLKISLEFVTFGNVTTLREVLDLCRAATRDNLGVLIDTLHFHRSRVALAELDAVPHEWFHFAHVCDAPADIPATREGLIHTARQERLRVGEGAIDIAAIVRGMPVVPYSLEQPHLAAVQALGYAEHARRCLAAAKESWEGFRLK